MGCLFPDREAPVIKLGNERGNALTAFGRNRPQYPDAWPSQFHWPQTNALILLERGGAGRLSYG
jgi:hypothetical protein